MLRSNYIKKSHKGHLKMVFLYDIDLWFQKSEWRNVVFCCVSYAYRHDDVPVDPWKSLAL